MHQFGQKTRDFLLKCLWKFVPSKLPVGVTALEEFSHKVLKTYGIPDLPSYRHAIAAMIMHLGPATDSVRISHIAKSIRKAMANQVAYEVIDKIKREEKAKAELETQAVTNVEPTAV